MGHAYTPGLKVTPNATLTKERKLPLLGDVLVEEGQQVGALDVVARTFLPGNVESVNVANKFSLPPEDVPEVMLVQEGDEVEKGQLIAQTKGLFGLFKSELPAPVKGTIENISGITGQVLLREPPHPVQVNAYIDGVIEKVLPKEGVVIRTQAAFIQGIFGIGGETHGAIKVVVDSPDDELTPDKITEDCKDKVVVGGSLVTNVGLRRAIEVGAVGVVAGGFHDKDLNNFLGFDLGVAITGHENKGVTLIVTEGFGSIAMAHDTFDLLQRLEGQVASINGATQIRAGVIRPEIIVPKPGDIDTKSTPGEEGGDLLVGTRIRVIREPYFGLLATVTDLPIELTQLESEAKVRVLKAKLVSSGDEVILPRANVELIES